MHRVRFGVTPLRQIILRLKKNQFVRRLSIMFGGMAIGQGLLIASTPLLTRMYTPEDFGIFAIFSALAAIMTTFFGLRYEIAIPLERTDRAAAALFGGICLTSLVNGVLLSLLIWAWGAPFATAVGAPELAPLLWLLPPCMVLWGIGSAASFWAIRRGMYRLNGSNRIVHYGSQAAVQLGFGPAGLGGAGLVFGYAVGYLARTAHLLRGLSSADRLSLRRSSFTDIRAVLYSYWRYPVFSGSAATLRIASTMLPPVLIAALYGPALAGFYALAQRVVGLPLRLIGESASHVFLGEIRHADQAGLLRLFNRLTILFTALGLFIMVPLTFLGPFLFSILFGAQWYDAGFILQLLLPLYLSRFIAMPIAHTLNSIERQDLLLLSAIINIFALFTSFGIGWMWNWEYIWTIGLFSILSSLTFVYTIVVSWITLKNVDWAALQAIRQKSEVSKSGSNHENF